MPHEFVLFKKIWWSRLVVKGLRRPLAPLPGACLGAGRSPEDGEKTIHTLPIPPSRLCPMAKVKCLRRRAGQKAALVSGQLLLSLGSCTFAGSRCMAASWPEMGHSCDFDILL